MKPSKVDSEWRLALEGSAAQCAVSTTEVDSETWSCAEINLGEILRAPNRNEFRWTGMSAPREIVPGRVYLVTRRCTQRQFLLRPDAETNNAFIYCLGYAAQRAAIKIVAFLASSNHYHAVVIDSDGRIPQFLEEFHRLVARHQNALRGRSENVWSTEQTSLVELVGESTALAKVIYTLANPVKDHLVAVAHHWPGASSLRATSHGETVSARRPLRFFRKEGQMPPTIKFRCHRIPGWEKMADDLYAAAINDGIKEVETIAAADRQRTGRSLLGRKAILGQSPNERPTSVPKKSSAHQKVASLSGWMKAEARARLKAFRAAYEAARQAWLQGERILFPQGTWWLKRFAAVPCEPFPLAA
ncbi:MAG TPA: hypothetical protein VGG33_13585 [Polyangia bacterium]